MGTDTAVLFRKSLMEEHQPQLRKHFWPRCCFSPFQFCFRFLGPIQSCLNLNKIRRTFGWYLMMGAKCQNHDMDSLRGSFSPAFESQFKRKSSLEVKILVLHSLPATMPCGTDTICRPDKRQIVQESRSMNKTDCFGSKYNVFISLFSGFGSNILASAPRSRPLTLEWELQWGSAEKSQTSPTANEAKFFFFNLKKQSAVSE